MAPKRRRTEDPAKNETVKAVILIGGPSRGTRFRPLSFNVPKPLFPVAGEALLTHHLEAVSKIPGLTEVILVGFFDPSLLHSFVNSSEAKFGIPVRYLREFQAMGTGGGIYHFRDQILRGKPDYLLILHSDVCFSFPLAEVIQFHKNNINAVATVVGKTISRDLTKNFGVVVSNESNEILHYAEKPETFVSDTINCGIYVFSQEIFEKLGEVFQTKNNESGEHTDVISLESDLFVKEAGNGRLFLFKTEGNWGQIKSAGSALSMNNLYLEHFKVANPEKLAKKSAEGPVIDGNVTIHPSAKIHPTAKIGPNVSIGPNVVIDEGARVRNSILLDNVQVKKRACVLNSIVGWMSVIGEWSRVEGGTPSAGNGSFPVDGIVKPTVTIFGEDVQVGDEVVIRNCVVLPHKELKASCANEVIM